MKATVHTTFPDYDTASDALNKLLSIGIDPKQMTIVGEDSDKFREATSMLGRHSISKSVALIAVLGAAIGAYWGFVGLPGITGDAEYRMAASAMGIICGAVLGLWTSIHTVGVLSIDNLPPTDAKMIEGCVDGSVMSLSIEATGERQLDAIISLLSNNPACVELAPTQPLVEQLVA